MTDEMRFPVDDGTVMVYNAEGELIREEKPSGITVHYLHGRKAYERTSSGLLTYLPKDGRRFTVHTRPEFILEISTPGEYKNTYMQNPDPNVPGRFATVVGPSAPTRARKKIVDKVVGLSSWQQMLYEYLQKRSGRSGRWVTTAKR